MIHLFEWESKPHSLFLFKDVDLEYEVVAVIRLFALSIKKKEIEPTTVALTVTRYASTVSLSNFCIKKSFPAVLACLKQSKLTNIGNNSNKTINNSIDTRLKFCRHKDKGHK